MANNTRQPPVGCMLVQGRRSHLTITWNTHGCLESSQSISKMINCWQYYVYPSLVLYEFSYQKCVPHSVSVIVRWLDRSGHKCRCTYFTDSQQSIHDTANYY